MIPQGNNTIRWCQFPRRLRKRISNYKKQERSLTGRVNDYVSGNGIHVLTQTRHVSIMFLHCEYKQVQTRQKKRRQTKKANYKKYGNQSKCQCKNTPNNFSVRSNFTAILEKIFTDKVVGVEQREKKKNLKTSIFNLLKCCRGSQEYYLRC